MNRLISANFGVWKSLCGEGLGNPLRIRRGMGAAAQEILKILANNLRGCLYICYSNCLSRRLEGEIYVYMLRLLLDFIILCFKTNTEKNMEISALRSQLDFFQCEVVCGKRPKPRVTQQFRRLWVFLSIFFDGWKDSLVIVTPATVIGWHQQGFKAHWRDKSAAGRPSIPWDIIVLVRKIHRENPELSPEKIHALLRAQNISDAPAPNTIAKYIRAKRRPPTDKQKKAWMTFLKNQIKWLWSMDFATVATIRFKVLHVLFIISHDRRKIEHFAVTEHPSSEWMAQQMRNATPFGHQPKYILHDNSSVFTSKCFQGFLTRLGIKSKRITPGCPWQNGICERLIGIVRRELLDHVIVLNERHLTALLTEYVHYYNHVRTHQALDGDTPVKGKPPPVTTVKDTILKATPILNGLYHSYEKESA